MRWDDVYVSSSAVVLGARESVDAAVGDGRYDSAIREAHGYESISVETTRDAVDMAVDAARAAIARSELDPTDIGLFVHAYVDEQGRLEPYSYIQGKAAAGRARAIAVQQGCNGAIASLEVGCLYVTRDPASGPAVLTSADKYAGESDRYTNDPGCVPADGATAVVLARGDGVARVMATEIVGDGSFSGLSPLDPGKFGDRREYLAELRRRMVSMMRAMGEAKRDCVRAALADAGVDVDGVDHWLLPYNGRFMVDRDFYTEFGIDDKQTTWERGRTIGHLTGGDPIVGLTHLLETGAVEVGDRAVMLGDSAGFSFGCAVVEIVRKPSWPADDDH